MNRALEDVFSGRLDTSYHRHGPSAEERARYLQHLRDRVGRQFSKVLTKCNLSEHQQEKSNQNRFFHIHSSACAVEFVHAHILFAQSLLIRTSHCYRQFSPRGN